MGTGPRGGQTRNRKHSCRTARDAERRHADETVRRPRLSHFQSSAGEFPAPPGLVGLGTSGSIVRQPFGISLLLRLTTYGEDNGTLSFLDLRGLFIAPQLAGSGRGFAR